MRRVDFIVGTRDFKTLKAEQFMQDNVYYLVLPRFRGQVCKEWISAPNTLSVPPFHHFILHFRRSIHLSE